MTSRSSLYAEPRTSIFNLYVETPMTVTPNKKKAAKQRKGTFMRRTAGYSPYYGEGRKTGPCRKRHAFQPYKGKQKCARCGWIVDVDPKPLNLPNIPPMFRLAALKALFRT